MILYLNKHLITSYFGISVLNPMDSYLIQSLLCLLCKFTFSLSCKHLITLDNIYQTATAWIYTLILCEIRYR